jgi:Flp pilus assembly protein TadG
MIRSRRLRPGHKESGSAIVETALSLTLFFTLLFGIVGWGWVMWAYIWTAQAARDGARWASVRGTTYSASYPSGNAASQTSIAGFVKAKTLGLSVSKVTVTATPSGSWAPGSNVTVTVNYVVTNIVPFVPSMTVSSTSTMLIVQ